MALSIPLGIVGHGGQELRPGAALRHAWVWYLSLLLTPFLVFLGVISYLTFMDKAPADQSLRNDWFLGSIMFTIIAPPIAFVARSWLFRSYWRGEGVNPNAYLKGMLIVWLTLEAAGTLSLVGCLMCHSITPCILPAIAAFIFFTALWPSGRAMARPTGNTDDPEIYAEPR